MMKWTKRRSERESDKHGECQVVYRYEHESSAAGNRFVAPMEMGNKRRSADVLLARD